MNRPTLLLIMSAYWGNQLAIHTTMEDTRPREGDVPVIIFDKPGRLDMDWVRTHLPLDAADFYVCGPIDFIRTFVVGLAAQGVSRERVHYEFFGAAEDLLDAWPEAPASAAPLSRPAAQQAATAKPAIAKPEIVEAILSSASDAVIVSDRDGAITMWNPGAERIFGFTEDEALGRSLDIIVPEPLRGRHWDGYKQTVASGQSRYGAGDILAVPGLHKDGRRISIEFTIAMIHDEAGQVGGMVAVLRDVTRRFEEMRDLRRRLAEANEARQS